MAKKFNFKLEPVLKLRQHKSALAKDELHRVLAIRMENERTISETDSTRKAVPTANVGKTTALEVQTNQHYRSFLEQELTKLEAERLKLLEIEKIKREKLSDAMKEEKILEKLKERKLVQYKEELLSEEMKFLDEIAIGRHHLGGALQGGGEEQ